MVMSDPTRRATQGQFEVLQIDIDALFLSVLLIGDLPPRPNQGGCFEGMKERIIILSNQSH